MTFSQYSVWYFIIGNRQVLIHEHERRDQEKEFCMYTQVYTHSTLTTADLQRRPVGMGDGGATAAGLRTAEGNTGFWATPARKGSGLTHRCYKLKTLGFPSEPADAREHKPKCLQAAV